MSEEGAGGGGASQMGMIQSDIHKGGQDEKNAPTQILKDLILRNLDQVNLVDVLTGKALSAPAAFMQSITPVMGQITELGKASGADLIGWIKKALKQLQENMGTKGFQVEANLQPHPFSNPAAHSLEEASHAMQDSGASHASHESDVSLGQTHPSHGREEGHEIGGGHEGPGH